MSFTNIKKNIAIIALAALTGAQCHAATFDADEVVGEAIVVVDTRTVDERFTHAAMEGNTELVRQLLESEANIKSTDTTFATALNLAVQYKHYDTIKFLLSHREGYQLRSLQALAARAVNCKLQQRAAIVGEQIITKARFDHKNISQEGLTFCFMQRFIAHANENPFSALTAVITYPSPDDLKNYPTKSIEQIKQYSRDIADRILTEYKDQFDAQAYTKALEMAALSGNAQIVSLLLNTQACITDRTLEYTINRGHTEIVTMLLNSIKTKSLEAHHAAEKTIDENTLKAEVAARINNANFKFNATLIKATKKHQAEMIHILLDAGANIDTIEAYGCAALRYPTDGCNEILSLLLSAGADVATPTYSTTLYEAIRNNHIELIHILLQAAKESPEINNITEEAFYHAIRCGSTQTAHLFLDAAIERSSRRSWGLASTSPTVSREYATAVGQLCQNAGLDITGDAGAAALLIASRAKRLEIVCLLLDAGAQVSGAIEQNGNTILHMNMNHSFDSDSRVRLVQILLHSGAATPKYINARNANDQTALKIAIQYAKILKEDTGTESLEGKEISLPKQLLIIDELLRAGAIVDDQARADLQELEPEFHKYID